MEPEIRRKFVLSDLHDNHNKFWLVEYWPDGRMRTTWGRVGITQQSKDKLDMRAADVCKLIREKEQKGYVEIDLFRPPPAPVSASGLDPRVDALIHLIHAEANDRIASYLAVGIDALSQRQINEGRQRLLLIQQVADKHYKGAVRMKRKLTQAVEEYLNIIPTRLPARIDSDEVVGDFVANLAEHEDRLNQLETATLG